MLTLPLAELLPFALGLVLAGAVTGVLAGLFGVGGGAVMVPILYEVFRLLGVDESVRMHLCVGTSLAIIIPTSIRSFRGHLKKGAADVATLRLWALPVVAGVALGGVLAALASGAALELVFALCLLVVGAKMLFGREEWRLAADLPGKAAMRLYGLLIGVLSTLMGIGGGLFGNLVLTLYNRPIHQAVATSSGLGVLIAAPAMAAYVAAGWGEAAALPPASLGYVSLVGFALVAPLSVATAPLGVRLAHGLSKRMLERLFGVYALAIAARFLVAAAT